jgi:hypothetical protein
VSVGLELRLERTSFGPGETVAGSVVVREGGGSRSLQVLLSYVERTADYLEVAWQVTTGLLHQGPLAAGASFPFALVLPHDALPGYSAPFGELYWELDAKSDELGLDSHARARIEVRAGAGAAAAAAAAGTAPERSIWDDERRQGDAWGSDPGVWSS